MTNSAKIDAFQQLVVDGGHFRKVEVDGWYERFNLIVERLHSERRRRNSLIHAQYLFDFLAIGAPVLRTHVQRRDGDIHFDQEDLTPRRCEEILAEVAQLSYDLNMICVQLYHVHLGGTAGN